MMVIEKAVRTSRPARGRKLVWLAVMLQCIPLLAAAGCINNGLSDQQGAGLAFLLWLSVFLWGFGYRYLERPVRCLLGFVLGPCFAFLAYAASSIGVTYNYERPYGATQADIDSADRATVQTGLLIAAAVLLMAVDAWRLAAAHNQSLQAEEVVALPKRLNARKSATAPSSPRPD